MTRGLHDKLFKLVFSAPAEAARLLQLALPPSLLTLIDLSRLEPRPVDLIDEALGERLSDLRFAAPLLGAESWITLLIEHQSQADPTLPLRLLRYTRGVWEQLRAQGARGLPLVVPVVVCHAPRPWSSARTLRALYDAPAEALDALAPYLPSADPVLYDLTPRSDAQIGGEAATRLTLLLLRHARDDDLWDTLCANRPLFEALITERGLGVASAVLRYVLEMGRRGPSDEARMVIRETMGEAADDDLLRYGDQLRQEGAAHARRLLFISLRAGPYASLPDWAWDRLNEAALDELERWLTQAPDAETLLSLLAPAPRSG
ncbi:MAG: Rpn family recombination-promoting nuclease/putative transposase [Deltaproteobacteria bacterium]|nr:Rpn family recombination-promoting nuclease/putative transposase [Deltaproteobacteria bacterium]